jgi:hypothetical protein
MYRQKTYYDDFYYDYVYYEVFHQKTYCDDFYYDYVYYEVFHQKTYCDECDYDECDCDESHRVLHFSFQQQMVLEHLRLLPNSLQLLMVDVDFLAHYN